MDLVMGATLLRTQTDERLLALARDGHAGAFEAVVHRYRRPLERYARRLLPPALVEDAVQAAFESAWTALRRGTDVRELRPWLYAIARNAALKTLARAGDESAELSEELAAAGASTPDVVVLRERTRATLEALAALPDRQRDAFLATVLEGRGRSEIAADLSLSEGAVRQLVHRARCAVREAATAVLPLPLVLRMAGGGGPAPAVPELVAGAGAAGALKLAAIVVATTAVAIAPAVEATRAPEPRAAQMRAPAAARPPVAAPAGTSPAEAGERAALAHTWSARPSDAPRFAWAGAAATGETASDRPATEAAAEEPAADEPLSEEPPAEDEAALDTTADEPPPEDPAPASADPPADAPASDPAPAEPPAEPAPEPEPAAALPVHDEPQQLAPEPSVTDASAAGEPPAQP